MFSTMLSFERFHQNDQAVLAAGSINGLKGSKQELRKPQPDQSPLPLGNGQADTRMRGTRLDRNT